MDEEKSKCAGLAQEIGSIEHFAVVAGKRRSTPPEKSVINMIKLLLSVSDWSRLFAISSTPPIRCPSFAKKSK